MAPPTAVVGGNHDPGVGGIAVGRIVKAIRRHVPLMLAVTTFTTTFALIASRQPPLYRVTAVLRLVGERRVVSAGIEQNEPTVDRHVVPLNSLVPRIRSRQILGAVVDSLGLQLRPVPTFSLLLPPTEPLLALRDVRVDPVAAADTLILLFSHDSLTVQRHATSKRHVYGEPIRAGSAEFTIASRPTMAGAVLTSVPRDRAIDRVLAQLGVTPLIGTDALEVRYIDTDPKRAQAIANQVVRTFYAATINSSQEQARRRRIFLEAQLGETERQLAQAQDGVSGFRSRRHLASSSDKLARQQSELMRLDARRGELQADGRVLRSLLSRLGTENDSARAERLYTLTYSPEIATDPIVGKLLQQLLIYTSRLDSLTTGSSPATSTNPDVLQLRQLVQSSQGELVRGVRVRLSSIEERFAALGELQARNAGEIARLPILEAEEARLGQKLSALSDFANDLRLEHQKARMSEELGAADVEIVDLATLPYLAAGVPWWVKVTLALVFGLVVGTIIALLWEMRNRSIRGPEEMEEILHVRGLGVIPPVSEGIAGDEALTPGRLRGRGGERAKLPLPGVVTDSSTTPSVGAEAFRLLYSSLTYGWGDRQRTILVTSVALQDGKTLVAGNLAVTFAREGARVLLVDCDLRRPRLHKMFRVSRSPGLVDLMKPAPNGTADDESLPEYGKPLAHAFSMMPEIAHLEGEAAAGPAGADEKPAVGNGPQPVVSQQPAHNKPANHRYLRETGSKGLWLLPSGTATTNTAETLKAGPFRRLLNELADSFDVIILDSPPALVSADAVILAPVADDVLLVVRAGQTDRDAAERLHQQLTDAGGHVVGAVLNDPEGRVTRDRTLYYSYGYPVSVD